MEEKIGAVAQGVATLGRLGNERLGLNGPQALDFQEFGDPLDAARLAPRVQFHGDSPRAVPSLVPPENVANQRKQLAVALRAGRLLLTAPGVEAGATDSQSVANGMHGEGSWKEDLFDDRVDVGYPPRLKMLKAFFRMSRSRSTRRSSASRK
jgi:hypothetical protein